MNTNKNQHKIFEWEKVCIDDTVDTLLSWNNRPTQTVIQGRWELLSIGIILTTTCRLTTTWSQENSDSVYNSLQTWTRITPPTFLWFKVSVIFLTAGDSGERQVYWGHTDSRWYNQLQRFLLLFALLLDCLVTFSVKKKWKMNFCSGTLFHYLLQTQPEMCAMVSHLWHWDICQLTRQWKLLCPPYLSIIPFLLFLTTEIQPNL